MNTLCLSMHSNNPVGRISNLFEHINTKLVLMNWVTYGRNFWKENLKKMVTELRLLRLSETIADWGLTP